LRQSIHLTQQRKHCNGQLETSNNSKLLTTLKDQVFLARVTTEFDNDHCPVSAGNKLTSTFSCPLEGNKNIVLPTDAMRQWNRLQIGFGFSCR